MGVFNTPDNNVTITNRDIRLSNEIRRYVNKFKWPQRTNEIAIKLIRDHPKFKESNIFPAASLICEYMESKILEGVRDVNGDTDNNGTSHPEPECYDVREWVRT